MSKSKSVKKRVLLIIAIFIILFLVTQIIFGKFNFITYASEQATLTFSDSGISETVSGSGYKISGTTLTISSEGTYRVTGSCSEGNIEIKKEH